MCTRAHRRVACIGTRRVHPGEQWQSQGTPHRAAAPLLGHRQQQGSGAARAAPRARHVRTHKLALRLGIVEGNSRPDPPQAASRRACCVIMPLHSGGNQCYVR